MKMNAFVIGHIPTWTTFILSMTQTYIFLHKIVTCSFDKQLYINVIFYKIYSSYLDVFYKNRCLYVVSCTTKEEILHKVMLSFQFLTNDLLK
jgi:hypothetical protein